MITYAIRKYLIKGFWPILENMFLLYVSVLGRVLCCASPDMNLLATLSFSDPLSAAEHGQQLLNEYASSGAPAGTDRGSGDRERPEGTVPREGCEAPGCAMPRLCLERGWKAEFDEKRPCVWAPAV